jgi:arylformamidase
VSVSGVHDLRPLTRSSINADLRLDDDEAARLSPVLLPPRCDAPIAIVVGAEETSEFLRQSALLFDAWPRQRPEGASGPIVVPGRHHFSIVADYAERGSALTAATLSQF